MIRFLTACIALAWAAVAAAAEPDMTFKVAGVSGATATKFQTDMQAARDKVRQWWGSTFEDPITVSTNADRPISMALIPAWRGERGQMIFGTKRVAGGEAATIHEMIHVYAPNANRMLAEGIAVYGHELLGGPSAYPNYGKDLHQAAASRANKDVMLKLERAATPKALEEIDKEGETLSGSFVRFLIERDGMEKFRALYAMTPLVVKGTDPGDIARWAHVYGQDYAALVDAWLTVVKKK
jgi:hypothetical protein